MIKENISSKSLIQGDWSSYLSQLQDVFGLDPIKHKVNKDIQSLKEIKFHEIDYTNEEFFHIENSSVKMTQVILADDINDTIASLVNEFENKDLLSKFSLTVDNKLLFYGPSWCGKTLLAYALANQLNKKLFIVNLSTIIDSSLGKTSSKIFQIFQTASLQKGILFFDEIDMLGKKRDDINDHGEMKRIATSILQALDFLDKDTLFIAATNFPDLVDSAILRRFNKKIAFQLPTKKQLQAYSKIILKEIGIGVSQSTMYAKIATRYSSLSFAEFRDEFVTQIKKYIIKKWHIKELQSDFLA